MCRSKIFLYFHVVITLGVSFLFGTSLVAQLVKKKKKIHLQCERPGSILGLGRSPGTRKGYPLQYSGLENSMGSIVAKSQTWLSDFHFHCCYNSEAVTGNLCAFVSYGTWLSFWWSVQFSRSVVSDSLRPHELQHTQASLSITNSQTLLKFTSIESVIAIQPSHPLLSCSPPAPGLFQFVWGGQSIGVSASASALPMNTQDWSPLEWTGWTSLQSKGLSRVFSNTTVQKHQLFGTQLSSQSNSHIHTWPLEKP